MNTLSVRAFGGLVFLISVMGGAIFWASGTFEYFDAWLFLAIFFVSSFLITVYLMKKDPALLQRRVHAGPTAESQFSQKIIQGIAQLVFFALLIIPGMDHQFHWSVVPRFVSIVGDLFVAAGFYIVFLVFKENSFTTATITVVRDQKLVSTGPYAVVRHPMYSGALLLLFGIPVGLGSWWGLLCWVPMIVVLNARLTKEELYLSENLVGYADYLRQNRWRLVPLVY